MALSKFIEKLLKNALDKLEYSSINKKNIAEIEGEIKSISDMIKRLQKRLTPQEIEDKLSLFDSKLAQTLVNNQGEEWASKMRNSFGSMMKDGSICSDCETKDEVLDAMIVLSETID